MEVRCTRDCKKKDKQGGCLADAISIEEFGCGAFVKVPEYEPFRADNVVIYDKAGIPSVMVRFSRVTDNELFGGSHRPHPAFVVAGKVYDEIYISKYPNTVINGKAYSLPMMKPETNVTFDDAVRLCKEKGEGWHLWTAAERGLIANICHTNEVFPHGNTNCGEWHDDGIEKGIKYDNRYKTLTGSGPVTWNHDHTPFGVSDLCGNIWEWFAGMRLMDGVVEVIPDNDAAANVDMGKDSKKWTALMADKKPVRINAEDGGLKFTTEESGMDYDGCEWGDVEFEFKITEEMKELGLFPGESEAYLYADTEGERLPFAGGYWYSGAAAGVFSLSLGNARSDSNSGIGFRSAFYGKLDSEI